LIAQRLCVELRPTYFAVNLSAANLKAEVL
jgi:hypothetical protein